MKNRFDIVQLDGDGIGPEINAQAIKVVKACQRYLGGFECIFESLPAGASLYRETGVAFPDATRKRVHQADAILLASMGLPDVRKPDGTEVQGDIIVMTRKELDLYKGVRPCKTRPNVPTPLTINKPIDLLVMREQSEGLFAAYQSSHIVHDQVYSDSMIITRRGTERIAKAAFEYELQRSSLSNHRPKVTCVGKSNNFQAMEFFERIVAEQHKNYPNIELNNANVDALMIWLVNQPEDYSTLVMENMYGDIVSDLTAAITGGMGFAPSGDIGDDHGMFQCAGGSAPTIAGKDIANPIAQIMSAAMMLKWLGEKYGNQSMIRAYSIVDQAIDNVLEAGHLTTDIGGDTKCSEFGDLVVKQIESIPK